jgi:hypothetical protein
MVDVAAFLIAALAVVASAFSAWFAKRAADSSDRSANASDRSAVASEVSATAARAEDRRARTPQFTIEREGRASNHETAVIFSLRNVAPDDLDSVTVHRPLTEDGVRYHVARVGADWSDVADLGALPLGQTGRFTLSIGSARKLPEFWVRITCRKGEDEWNLLERLVVRRPGRVIVSG